MGYPKLSADVRGKGKLGSLALRSALRSGIGPVIVVTKAGPVPDWLAEIEGEHQTEAYTRVESPNAELGMAHSIRAGYAQASRGQLRGIVILLADMPLVTAEMIRDLADRYEAEPHLDFVAYRQGGLPLPPVLLASSMFPHLRHLEGDAGARRLLQDPRFCGAFLQAETELSLADLDTEEDWALMPWS
ncbi:nucleotidyltransferase family protein [Paenibacillus soyae]|uniref:NTP transferase domain-containing protein n=1 Tax=Paenibacillus soyae TaxID=2969249 RepID=A0A9X2MRI4_9BACL|nr:NTP transferase domain-containing protein [Paenibacillus soyae]MCR2805509.1 NTP transferase domain-containing protein [Paenibacillus soyae]